MISPTPLLSRRASLGRLALLGTAISAGCAPYGLTARGRPVRIATFSADVTVPLGHGMMGGAWVSKKVVDPLEARGVVLMDGSHPVVFVSVDWCEIRNDAYARWQEVLAQAAGTTPDRVLLTTIHQHDTPVADLEAERILRSRHLAGSVCDPEFHEQAVQSVGRALSASLSHTQVIDAVGMGQAEVRQVASNRRYHLADGGVRFDRMSATRNALAIAGEDGLIDPWLRTLSFWRGDQAVAAISFYAVHPMSYYGQGEVSADFPGLARRQRQLEMPGVFQIYSSGCSGNVTAGKYNDGSRENRPVLADRLRQAMQSAWSTTRREPLRELGFRSVPLILEPRSSSGFTEADLNQILRTQEKPFQQCLAAMGLSWRRRVATGRPITIPAVSLGSARILVLPGESYVEYQLAAQQLRPDCFVCTAGYGDGATGYIPTEQHWAEKDPNLGDWCWVAPGSEARVRAALRQVLEG